MNFVYVIYNKNNPNTDFIYSTDLFDLFGSPDGIKSGFIYSITRVGHKKLKWDWGYNGFRNVLICLYRDKYKTIRGFEKFYNDFKNNRIKIDDYFNFPINAVYQVKPNNSIIFPAIIIDIHQFEKDNNRIWLTFTPKAYFVIDPPSWKLYTQSRTDYANWYDLTNDHQELKEILRSSSQSQHRIYPKKTFSELFDLSSTDTFFYKKIDLSHRTKRERDVSENQIFWNMYQSFTDQSQVIGDAFFKYVGKTYEVKGIPTNTLSKANAVYKHEIGIAQVIYSALSTCFEDHFIDIEFGEKKSIYLDQSKIVKRAYKIKNFKCFNENYANTDYDYVIDLKPLGVSKVICFDLTVGLWNKGRDKTIDEYLSQWQHNLVYMADKNDQIITVFSFGIDQKEKQFFHKQSNFDGCHDFLEHIADGKNFQLFDQKGMTIDPSCKIINVAFFNHLFNREIANFMESPRETLNYLCLLKILKSFRFSY